jgi:2-dehydro-3-deoxygluconokinase
VTSSPEVVTLGESMVLFLPEQAGPLREATTFRRHIAGAESNVAVGLCRLGQTAGWISRVGDDEFGRAILFRLRGEGVDISTVAVDAEASTGIYFRERREVGPVDVIYYRRGSAASRLSPADLDPTYIGGARYLHLTGITPALSPTCRDAVFSAAEIARSAGVTVVLDPNIRLKLWSAEEARAVLRDLAGHCDVVLPGLDEAQLLTTETDPQRAARALLDLGPSLVVVKLGADGALAVSNVDVVHGRGVPLARVVDPVGAGDAFAAGLLSGVLRGLAMPACLQLANRCGALAMSAPGDMEALPTSQEVYETSNADVRR